LLATTAKIKEPYDWCPMFASLFSSLLKWQECTVETVVLEAI
jgi:hypothetical protein